MNIDEMATNYLSTIMPSDPNINPSEYQSEYDAFVAGANAVKNNVDLADVSERVWTVDEIIAILDTHEDAGEHSNWFDKHGR